MRHLNAVEAISPALARTQLLMFRPFRVGRTWKIAATGYATALGGFFLPWPLLYVPLLIRWHRDNGASMAWVAGIAAVLAVISAVYVVLFVLCSRLRFALFGMVATNQRMVRPMWRLYGARAAPWTWWKIVAGSVVCALLAVPLISVFRTFGQLMANMQVKPGQPLDPHAMAALMSFYLVFGWFYLGFGVCWWAISLLSDFIQPSLALEGVSLREAFRRAGALVQSEPGTVVGYALLKPLLAIAGFVGMMIAFYLAVIVVVILVVLFGLLVGFLLHRAHVPGNVLGMMAAVIGLPLYIAVAVYGMFLTLGSVYVFLEAYAQCFLAGRYPLLGDLLDRSTPQPPPPPGWPPTDPTIVRV